MGDLSHPAATALGRVLPVRTGLGGHRVVKPLRGQNVESVHSTSGEIRGQIEGQRADLKRDIAGEIDRTRGEMYRIGWDRR